MILDVVVCIRRTQDGSPDRKRPVGMWPLGSVSVLGLSYESVRSMSGRNQNRPHSEHEDERPKAALRNMTACAEGRNNIRQGPSVLLVFAEL